MDRKNFQMQIGKNGLTESFIEQLKKEFERENLIKISILKSATRDKEDAKRISDELLKALGNKYTARLVGYVLTVQKWRKPKQ